MTTLKNVGRDSGNLRGIKLVSGKMMKKKKSQKIRNSEIDRHGLVLEALLRTARRSRNLVKYTRKRKHKSQDDE